MAEIDHLRTFVTVAESGGFAAAARRLGVSAPAVTRAVAALEQHLGARLLHRTTRHVRVTDIGERFLQDARRILAELDEAESSARGAHSEPQGELAITASVMFGRLHVAPLLFDFLARYPRVTSRALFVDRVVNLMEEGFDVAVRIAHLPDSSFTAVQVGSVRRVVVASPAYLEAHGTPSHPSELKTHRAIRFAQSGATPTAWTFSVPGESGLREAPAPRAPLLVNAGDVAIDAAVAGHGLARALYYQVRGHLAAGRLVRVLQPFEVPPIPVQLIYPEGRRAAAKVRAFVDFATARLRAEPALREA
jgi:DNA-binding transcriptional LysR family regulator